jgi:hypothetical protein
LWNIAFAASQLDVDFYGDDVWSSVKAIAAHSRDVMQRLAERPTTCPGCQRSAEIHRGDYLGPERRQWRAEMWQSNPSMHFMMRQGSTETFQEDAK